MPRRSLLVLAVALALSACAPTPARFVAGGRYDEAVCAASLFSDDKARDGALVLRAINEHLRPALHVHALTRRELTDAIGPLGERVNDQVLIVRVVMSAWSVNGLTARPDLELAGSGVRPLPRPATGAFSERGPGQPVGPTRELLSGLTAESLPSSQHVETGPSVLDKAVVGATNPVGALAALGELLTLGIVPVMQMAGVVPPHRSYDAAPSEEAYMRKAPAAETLYRSFKAMSGSVLIFARPSGDDVALRTTWLFESSSYDGRCELMGTAYLPLPPGGSIEERINRRFGERLTRVGRFEQEDGKPGR